jgi:hypothetical protein
MYESEIKDNEQMAKFMHTKKEGSVYFIPELGHITLGGNWKTEFDREQLKYHKEWKWLMPVVRRVMSNEFKLSRVESTAKALAQALCKADIHLSYKYVLKLINMEEAYKEADEISEEDLQASADYFDKLVKE